MDGAEAGWVVVEEADLAAIIRIDREDLALRHVGEDVVALQLFGIACIREERVAARDGLHLDAGIGVSVGEGTIGRRNVDLARFDGLVEGLGVRRIAVKASGQQRAAITALIIGPAEIVAADSLVDLFVVAPTRIGQEQATVFVEAHGERVAQTRGVDLGLVQRQVVARLHERIVGQPPTRDRVDA